MITLKMASPRSAVTLPAPLQEVRRLDLPMPAGLILISPWLDATMSAPEQAQLEAHDPVLRRGGRAAAEANERRLRTSARDDVAWCRNGTPFSYARGGDALRP